MFTTVGTVLLTIGAYGLLEKYFIYREANTKGAWKESEAENIPTALEVVEDD